jgi:hydrogenase expression/formation protein HypC
MRVIKVFPGRALCERYGKGRQEQSWIDMTLVGQQRPDTWVLVFLETAREVVSAEQAALIGKALDALSVARTNPAADFDRLFPDLAGREPELPDHLKAQRTKGRT